MSEEDLKRISGGEERLLADLFNNIFDLSYTSLTFNMRKVFIQQITDLVGTPAGHSLLESLVYSGHALSVVGDTPSNPSTLAEYVSTTNTLKIGNMDVNINDSFYPGGCG